MLREDKEISLISALQSLLVRQLKELCRASQIPVSGRKSVLIERIISNVDSRKSGEGLVWVSTVLKRVCMMMNEKHGRAYFLRRDFSIVEGTNPMILSSTELRGENGGHYFSLDGRSTQVPLHYLLSRGYSSKSDPLKHLSSFMNILRSLNPFLRYVGDSLACTIGGGGTMASTMSFTVTEDMLRNTDDIRIYSYSFSGMEMPSVTSCSWPHLLSITINAHTVVKEWSRLKSSLKLSSVKGGALLREGKFVINFDFPPPDTGYRYVFVARLVRSLGVVDLRKIVLENQKGDMKFHLERAHAMLRFMEGDEIEEVSRAVSLLCPLVLTKIITPVRGKNCTHIQCFDLDNFLNMNKAYGTWKCPICKAHVEPGGIVVDKYVESILKNTGEEVEEIDMTREKWFVNKDSSEKKEGVESDESDMDIGEGPAKRRKTEEEPSQIIPGSITLRLEGTSEFPILIE